jgi:hypothetical protein
MAKEALDAMFAATDPSYSASSQTPSFAVGLGFTVHAGGIARMKHSQVSLIGCSISADSFYVAGLMTDTPLSCKHMHNCTF